jgi:hypothetical protein
MDYYYGDESACAIDSTNTDEFDPRILPSINGYSHLPIVSLKEAVHPVIALVPNVERMVDMVLQHVGQHPKNGLTVAQSASIMLYTLEWTPRKKSFSRVLNKTILKHNNREDLKPWLLYFRLIFSALALLPPRQRTVYRGIQKNLQAYYPIREKVVWWDFSTCTTKSELLQDEQFCGNSGFRTIFQIECFSGVNIRNHSFYRDRYEVLILPDTEFEVISSSNDGYGLTEIQLREIRKGISETQSLATLDVAQLPVIVEPTYEQPPIARWVHQQQVLEYPVSIVVP